MAITEITLQREVVLFHGKLVQYHGRCHALALRDLFCCTLLHCRQGNWSFYMKAYSGHGQQDNQLRLYCFCL